MNRQAMSDLADFIETRDVHMGMFSNKQIDLAECASAADCGTMGCIAGWCIVKHFDEYKAECQRRGRRVSELDFSAKKLGLTMDERYALFTPNGCYLTTQPRDAKQKALKVLRGEIPLTNDWLVP